jgi:hypothetical protein
MLCYPKESYNMSLYSIKFFKEGVLIYETQINHNWAFKALLYAEGEFKNKNHGGEYDQVEIKEIDPK